jgi:hypothetical protein
MAEKKQRADQYEHYEQVALFSWLALQEAKYPALACAYAVPNAAKRSPRQGAWMKAEGMKAGVPDVVLPVLRQVWGEGPDAHIPLVYGGLYVEMKAPDKYPRPNQKEWADRLEKWGMKVIRRCTTWQEAARHMLEYLGVPVTRHSHPELFV